MAPLAELSPLRGRSASAQHPPPPYPIPRSSQPAQGDTHGTITTPNDRVKICSRIIQIKLLREPSQLMTLYIGDVLLANPDRRTYGNVLLHRTDHPRQFDLLPIDQSDCFNHPGDLQSSDRLTTIRGDRIAAWLPGTESAILALPDGFPAAEVARVQALKTSLCDAVRSVPDEWYDRAGVEPSSISDFLAWRLDHLGTLVDIPYSEGLKRAIGGGHVIEL
jgi:hypothetical protein